MKELFGKTRFFLYILCNWPFGYTGRNAGRAISVRLFL